MFPSTATMSHAAAAPPPPPYFMAQARVAAVTTHTLTDQHRAEVLEFLSRRPTHTVVMVGFIRDNGLSSPLNRGTFHGCRNPQGELLGVALIGHATLVETQNDEALACFARLARDCPRTHVMMGEQERIERFWSFYAQDTRSPRLICREQMMEQRWPVEVRESIEGLRLATLEELEQVMVVQAEMSYEECGVNPLEKDPEGFRRRCARRIEQGRVWVLMQGERLVFKADVISETPEVNYIEGVWVSPEERGKGYGLRCLSQMSQALLTRTQVLTLLVNEKTPQALPFYRKAGYKLSSYYDTIYLDLSH